MADDISPYKEAILKRALLWKREMLEVTSNWRSPAQLRDDLLGVGFELGSAALHATTYPEFETTDGVTYRFGFILGVEIEGEITTRKVNAEANRRRYNKVSIEATLLLIEKRPPPLMLGLMHCSYIFWSDPVPTNDNGGGDPSILTLEHDGYTTGIISSIPPHLVRKWSKADIFVFLAPDDIQRPVGRRVG